MKKAEGRNQRSAVRDQNSAFCISSRGQALIEACLVIALICLILAGLFQLAQIYSARIIALHACARGARAQTVGFNQFMVAKAVRVATIGNAGQMTFPEVTGGPLAQMAVEHGRIPLYLGAEWHMLNGVLQYEDWDTINYNFTDLGGDTFDFTVAQALPLRYFEPIFRAFYGTNVMPIVARLRMDNHAALYLE